MRFTIVVPVMFVIFLGCQKDEPLEPHVKSEAEPRAASEATAVPSTADAVATATTPPFAPSGAAAAAGLASADGEQSGVTLTVTEFKRTSGDTVTLKFNIANNGAEAFNFGYDLGDPAQSTIDFSTIGGVHLLDPVNKKKYFVVRDSESRCVCSRDLDAIKPGSQLNLWAKFPAPADTQKVSIVVPHFMPMDDVPIS